MFFLFFFYKIMFILFPQKTAYFERLHNSVVFYTGFTKISNTHKKKIISSCDSACKGLINIH